MFLWILEFSKSECNASLVFWILISEFLFLQNTGRMLQNFRIPKFPESPECQSCRIRGILQNLHIQNVQGVENFQDPRTPESKNLQNLQNPRILPNARNIQNSWTSGIPRISRINQFSNLAKFPKLAHLDLKMISRAIKERDCTPDMIGCRRLGDLFADRLGPLNIVTVGAETHSGSRLCHSAKQDVLWGKQKRGQREDVQGVSWENEEEEKKTNLALNL